METAEDAARRGGETAYLDGAMSILLPAPLLRALRRLLPNLTDDQPPRRHLLLQYGLPLHRCLSPVNGDDHPPLWAMQGQQRDSASAEDLVSQVGQFLREALEKP